MPYRLTIEKFLPTAYEYWTNVYYVDAVDFADAAQTANSVVAAERSIHLTSVIFTKYRIDDNVPNTDNFITVNLNVNGTRPVNDDPVPLWTTFRVDLPAIAGRPSRKYYRGVLREDDVNAFGTLASQALTEFEAFCSTLGAIGALVDPDGQAILSATCAIVAAMRQLRRGSKKKLTP